MATRHMTNIRTAERNTGNGAQARERFPALYLTSLKVTSTLTLLLALSACGGGGGSGSGGGGGGGGGGCGQGTTLRLSTSALSVSGSVTDTTPPIASVTVTLVNPPASTVYIGVGASKNGISSLNYTNSGGAQATVSVNFKYPYTLAAGQYQDTLAFEACTDNACNDVIPGATASIPVTYTVSAPAGPNTPQLILGSHNLQATANAGDQSPPAMQSIAVSVSNVSALGQFTISVSQQQPSIFQVQTQLQSSIAGQINVSFETPTQLLP